jgi:hypothetical protein
LAMGEAIPDGLRLVLTLLRGSIRYKIGWGVHYSSRPSATGCTRPPTASDSPTSR